MEVVRKAETWSSRTHPITTAASSSGVCRCGCCRVYILIEYSIALLLACLLSGGGTLSFVVVSRPAVAFFGQVSSCSRSCLSEAYVMADDDVVFPTDFSKGFFLLSSGDQPSKIKSSSVLRYAGQTAKRAAVRLTFYQTYLLRSFSRVTAMMMATEDVQHEVPFVFLPFFPQYLL